MDFDEVMEREEQGLRTLANYLLPNANAVDDVLQLTRLRAHEQWADFREGEDFGPWLRTILRFMVKTELKNLGRESQKRQRYRREWFSVLENHLESAPDVPSVEFDLHAALLDCRDNLAEQAAALIGMKYDQGLSCADIAERRQKSVSWVTTTLSRVRLGLKQCIESKRLDFHANEENP